MCRVVKEKTVPPASKASVLAQTRKAETYKVEATPMESDRNRLSVAKEIVEILSYYSFYIMVAKTSEVPVSLLKTMKVAALGNAPSKIVPVRDKVPEDPVSAMPIYRDRQDKKLQFEQHQQVAKKDKKIKRTIGKFN